MELKDISNLLRDTSYDNRGTCVNMTPTGCQPYTGYVGEDLDNLLPCRPNANDIFKFILLTLENLETKLGDNTKLDKSCLSFTADDISQKDLNQEFITQICLLKSLLVTISGQFINADNIIADVNLGCLIEDGCEPQPEYSVLDVLKKLLIGYCNLLDRVTILEETINL